jgi:hypothetical protein
MCVEASVSPQLSADLVAASQEKRRMMPRSSGVHASLLPGVGRLVPILPFEVFRAPRREVLPKLAKQRYIGNRPATEERAAAPNVKAD